MKGALNKPKIGAHTQVNASINSAHGLKTQFAHKEKVVSANNLLSEKSGTSSAMDSGQSLIT